MQGGYAAWQAAGLPTRFSALGYETTPREAVLDSAEIAQSTARAVVRSLRWELATRVCLLSTCTAVHAGLHQLLCVHTVQQLDMAAARLHLETDTFKHHTAETLTWAQ